MGKLNGTRQDLVVRDDVVDPSIGLSLLSGRRLAREDQLERLVGADYARQTHESSRQRSQATLRLRQGKRRLLRSDDDVAGERKLKATAVRDSVHSGDNRLKARFALHQPAESRQRRHILGVGLGDLAGVRREVCNYSILFYCQFLSSRVTKARAERPVARSSHNRHPQVGIGLKVVPDLGQLCARLQCFSVYFSRHKRQTNLPRSSGRSASWDG